MLVLEPRKRFTIAQIKAHRWMMSDSGAPQEPPPSPDLGHNPANGEFNEQILRLMQSLGIDQQKTIEVGPGPHRMTFVKTMPSGPLP